MHLPVDLRLLLCYYYTLHIYIIPSDDRVSGPEKYWMRVYYYYFLYYILYYNIMRVC